MSVHSTSSESHPPLPISACQTESHSHQATHHDPLSSKPLLSNPTAVEMVVASEMGQDGMADLKKQDHELLTEEEKVTDCCFTMVGLRFVKRNLGSIMGTLAFLLSIFAVLLAYSSSVSLSTCRCPAAEHLQTPQPAAVFHPNEGSPTPADGQRPLTGEKLIFVDNFDDFDLSFWEHEITAAGGGNWEFQYYANNRSNSFTSNGILHIKPTLTQDTVGQDPSIPGTQLDLYGLDEASTCTGPKYWGCQRTTMDGNVINPIQSARIRTAPSLSIKYGRIEARMRLPKGDWLWPAFWLLPRYNVYGNWPASGEIDIMESRGNAQYPDEYEGGVDTASSTLHWGPVWNRNGYKLTHQLRKMKSGDYNNDFHVFGLFWNSTRLYTYLDDPSHVTMSIDMGSQSFWDRGVSNDVWPNTFANPWRGSFNKNAPFDQEFYLLFNLAVGGVTEYWKSPAKPWNTDRAPGAFWAARNQWVPTWKMDTDQADLLVDWVKVWAFPESSYTLRGVHSAPVHTK